MIIVVFTFLFSVILGNNNFQSVKEWFGDSGFTIWTLDSNYKFIYGLKDSFSNSPIFYPYTDSFYFSDHLITQTLIGLPVYVITKSSISAYNFSFLMCFNLLFCGMFLLTKYLFKSKVISLVVAILFTFNTFILNQLSHFQLLSIGILPFCIYFFEKSISKESSKSSIFLFGLSIASLMLSNAYYLIFTMLLVFVYFIPRYIYKKMWKNKSINRLFFITFVVVTILVGVFSFKYLEVSKYQGVNRGLGEVTDFSSDITSLFLPNNNALLYKNTFLNSLTPEQNVKLYGFFIERSLYWGIIITILLIIGVFNFSSLNKDKKSLNLLILFDKRIHFLLVIMFFLLICFGPVIKVYNNVFDIFTLYDLLRKVFPFINSLRAIGRSFAFAIPFAILLSAYGLVQLKYIIDNTKIKLNKKLILLIVSIVLIIISLIDTFSFTLTISDGINNLKNDKVNLDLLTAGSKNTIFFPDLNNVQIINNSIPSFDIPLRNQLLTMNNNNLKIVNGYSGIFPSDIQEITKYIEKNGFNKSVLYSLKNIGVDTIVLRSNLILENKTEFYSTSLKNASKLGYLELKNDESAADKIYEIKTTKLQNLEQSKIVESIQTYYHEKDKICYVIVHFKNDNELAFGQKEVKRDIDIKLKNRIVRVSVIEPIFIPEKSEVLVYRFITCSKEEI